MDCKQKTINIELQNKYGWLTMKRGIQTLLFTSLSQLLGEEGKPWATEGRADAMAARQGFNLVRRGFAKLD